MGALLLPSGYTRVEIIQFMLTVGAAVHISMSLVSAREAGLNLIQLTLSPTTGSTSWVRSPVRPSPWASPISCGVVGPASRPRREELEEIVAENADQPDGSAQTK